MARAQRRNCVLTNASECTSALPGPLFLCDERAGLSFKILCRTAQNALYGRANVVRTLTNHSRAKPDSNVEVGVWVSVFAPPPPVRLGIHVARKANMSAMPEPTPNGCGIEIRRSWRPLQRERSRPKARWLLVGTRRRRAVDGDVPERAHVGAGGLFRCRRGRRGCVRGHTRRATTATNAVSRGRRWTASVESEAGEGAYSEVFSLGRELVSLILRHRVEHERRRIKESLVDIDEREDLEAMGCPRDPRELVKARRTYEVQH